MSLLPPEILAFLKGHHVLTLSTTGGPAVSGGNAVPWAANCFYAMEEEDPALLILSHHETRHGAEMAINPAVAGTVSGQEIAVARIRGLQFSAVAAELHGEAAARARVRYDDRFSFARTMPAPIWRLRLTHLKLTDNSRGFGFKTVWDFSPTA